MNKIKMKKRLGLIGAFMVAVAMVALTGVAHAQTKINPNNLIYPIGEGKFTWASYHDFAKAHDYSGQQLTITTRTGGDLEIGLSNALAYFAEATGAKVSHLGNLKDFKQAVVTNHEGGTSPNITGIQLVGFGKDMAKRGAFTPQCYDMANCELLDWFRDNYASGQDWIDSGTWEGPDGKKHWYGPNYFTFHFENVYYVPENFEDEGYKVPQTMEELKALEDRIVADGGTPWCHGLLAGDGTGFTAQQLMADFLLRSQPIDVYDKYTTNEIKMDDPRIVAALEELGKILLDDKKVAGGPNGIPTLNWITSAAGLFSNPPECYMYHQGTYMSQYLPKDKKYGDWDFFYFPKPPNKPGFAKYPVNGGGAFMTITKDSPVARGFIEWIKTPIAHELWIAQGGTLTPHKHVNKALFADEATAKMNEILLNADPFRFNAGEVFPSAVGGICLNRAMVDYVGGKSAKEALRVCQEIWDGLK